MAMESTGKGGSLKKQMATVTSAVEESSAIIETQKKQIEYLNDEKVRDSAGDNRTLSPPSPPVGCYHSVARPAVVFRSVD